MFFPLHGRTHRRASCVVLAVALCLAAPRLVTAQDPAPSSEQTPQNSRIRSALEGVAGGALGLALHESAHLAFGWSFDASPRLERVSYAGIPFFAITHDPVSPVREFAISSAGFWMQHASTELLLSRRPQLRHEHAPIVKGMFAFNILVSVMYSGAAVFRTGPAERDTRSIAASARIAEPWVAPLLLAPAALDTVRYFSPQNRGARWASRAVKLAGVVMILKAH